MLFSQIGWLVQILLARNYMKLFNMVTDIKDDKSARNLLHITSDIYESWYLQETEQDCL